MDKLSKRSFQTNMEFIQFMKCYWDMHAPNGGGAPEGSAPLADQTATNDSAAAAAPPKKAPPPAGPKRVVKPAPPAGAPPAKPAAAGASSGASQPASSAAQQQLALEVAELARGTLAQCHLRV